MLLVFAITYHSASKVWQISNTENTLTSQKIACLKSLFSSPSCPFFIKICSKMLQSTTTTWQPTFQLFLLLKLFLVLVMKQHHLAISFVLTITPVVPSAYHSFLLELHYFSSVPRMKFVETLLKSTAKMSPWVFILSFFRSALKTNNCLLLSASTCESYPHLAKLLFVQTTLSSSNGWLMYYENHCFYT